MSLPLNWSSPAFLAFYAAAVALAAMAAWVLPALTRPAGRYRRVTEPAELAMLGGGAERVAEAGIADAMARGELILIDKRFSAPPGRGASGTGSDWTGMRERHARPAEAARRRLVADGLMLDKAATSVERWLAAGPLAAVLALGAVRCWLGLMRDRPFGWLLLMMVVAAILLVAAWRGVTGRTRAGDRAWRQARDEADRIRRAPTRAEMGLAVALFGTGVLAGSHLHHLHQLRSGNGGGGDGGSGCGSNGGSDGGGCGGCGGD